MKKINEKLCVGDKIMIWKMQDEFMKPGTKGVVTSVNHLFGDTIYGVDWESGQNYNLLSDVDVWILNERTNQNCNPSLNEGSLNESSLGKFEMDRNFINKHIDELKYFDKKILLNFLESLRKCSWVNMINSSVYLYAGKENIKKMHPFNKENEFCDEMLEMADDAKHAMINGTIQYLEDNNKEITVESVNSKIKRMSSMILQWFILRKG